MTNQSQQPAEPTDEDVKAVGQLRKARERLRQEIGRVVVGPGTGARPPAGRPALPRACAHGRRARAGQDADGQDDRAARFR